MNIVLQFHDRLATTVLLYFLAVGVWGLLEYARGGSVGGNIGGALVLGQVLVVVQGSLGMVEFLFGDRPADMIHLLYGFTAALAMPFVWSYMRDRAPRQALLFYSLVALFIFGLAVRGIVTGE